MAGASKSLLFGLLLLSVFEISSGWWGRGHRHHHKHGWTEDEPLCPLANPCTCSWKDVSVQIQNKKSWKFWQPSVSTVYRHKASCSNKRLNKRLPDLNVTDSNKDFALFDFSYNKLSTFPDDYFDSVPELLVLNLTSNHFRRVPEAVSKNAKLIKLSFSDNKRFQLGMKSPFKQMSRLQTLLLDNCKIRHLRANVFEGLQQLGTLKVDHNDISLVEPGLFKNTPSLTTLMLNSNKLNTVSPDYFEGLTNLITMSLGDNSIKEIPTDCFKHTPNLKTLHLLRNKIKVLHEDSFYNLVHLTALDLGHNLIQQIPNRMFDKFNVIETLHLSRNKLNEMKYDQFLHMPETLKTLNLASNDLTIKSFDTKVFSLFPNLEVLSLSNNPLQLIPKITDLKTLVGLSIAHTKVAHVYPCDLEGLEKLETFLWTGSPIACDCQNQWLVEWFNTNLDDGERRRTEEELIWKCHSPPNMVDKLFHDMTDKDFGCSPDGDGTSSNCHRYDGSGITAAPTTTSTTMSTNPPRKTTEETFDDDDYAIEDSDSYESEDDVGTEKEEEEIDEEDEQDEHDLNVLLGLNGAKTEAAEGKSNVNGDKTESSSLQIIVLSTLACIIIIVVAVIAIVFVMRKKRKYTRDRMNQALSDINSRRADEPPPYVSSDNSFQENRWDLPPPNPFQASPPTACTPADPLGASGDSKPPLPEGGVGTANLNLSAAGGNTQVCSDNSSLPTKL